MVVSCNPASVGELPIILKFTLHFINKLSLTASELPYISYSILGEKITFLYCQFMFLGFNSYFRPPVIRGR